jgi:hypothetical protein
MRKARMVRLGGNQALENRAGLELIGKRLVVG